ncbi:MAG: Na+ dependent nucleoside transporter N-terminal domain-containing protein, partial [Pseudomonadota bacterium]
MGWEAGQSALGLVVFLLVAWALSENRRAINVQIIATGVGIQVVLALLLFKLPFMQAIFVWLNQLVLVLSAATDQGTGFVFGYLGGGDLPFEPKEGVNTFILAFKALPLLLVMSALTSMLFYWRVLPYIVLGFSWILQKA